MAWATWRMAWATTVTFGWCSCSDATQLRTACRGRISVCPGPPFIDVVFGGPRAAVCRTAVPDDGRFRFWYGRCSLAIQRPLPVSLCERQCRQSGPRGTHHPFPLDSAGGRGAWDTDGKGQGWTGRWGRAGAIWVSTRASQISPSGTRRIGHRCPWLQVPPDPPPAPCPHCLASCLEASAGLGGSLGCRAKGRTLWRRLCLLPGKVHLPDAVADEIRLRLAVVLEIRCPMRSTSSRGLPHLRNRCPPKA